MDAIAEPHAAQAYAKREGLVDAEGLVAIFVDSRCRPLGTSRMWSAGRQVAGPVEQVREGLRLGAAGLLLVCDTARTAAFAARDVAALQRLASDYGLLMLDVIPAADEADSPPRLQPDLGSGRARTGW